MKTMRSNLFKLAIAITFLVMLSIVIAFNQSNEPTTPGSKSISELYRPFIVFAPGFAALLEAGY